jgi:hypothetical protein
MAFMETVNPVDDRFDGITRGDTDGKAELLTPEEEMLLQAGVEAPSGANDRPNARAGDDDPDKEEMLDPAEEALLQAGVGAPTSPRRQAATDASKPKPAAAAPPRPQQESTAADPGADELNRRAAEQWTALQQQPNFHAHVDQLLAQERQRDPEPLRESVVEHMEWQTRENARELRGIQTASQMATEYDTGIRVLNTVREQESEWSKSHPDYHQRVNFMREQRDRELQIMGYSDPAARERIIIANAAMILQNAIRQRQNPAAIIHAMSEAQGFRASSQAPAGRQGASGGTRAPAPARSGRVDLSTLAGMSDEAYDAFVAQNGIDLSGLGRK